MQNIHIHSWMNYFCNFVEEFYANIALFFFVSLFLLLDFQVELDSRIWHNYTENVNNKMTKRCIILCHTVSPLNIRLSFCGNRYKVYNSSLVTGGNVTDWATIDMAAKSSYDAAKTGIYWSQLWSLQLHAFCDCQS